MIGEEVTVGISGSLAEVEIRALLKGEFVNTKRIGLRKEEDVPQTAILKS